MEEFVIVGHQKAKRDFVGRSMLSISIIQTPLSVKDFRKYIMPSLQYNKYSSLNQNLNCSNICDVKRLETMYATSQRNFCNIYQNVVI